MPMLLQQHALPVKSVGPVQHLLDLIGSIALRDIHQDFQDLANHALLVCHALVKLFQFHAQEVRLHN